MTEHFFSNYKEGTVTSDRVLYTASAFARSSLLYLQEIGSLQAKKSHTSKRSGLQSFLFFTVVKGSGKLVYEDREYELHQGSCVFINCKTPYSHTTDERNLWTLKWTHFYGPTLSLIYDKYCERGGRPAFDLSAPEEVRRIDECWTQLMNIAKGNDYIRDMLINEQLSTLIRLIMERSWHPENRTVAPKKRSVVKVKAYIDEHYTEKITLEELSSRFFMDKYYMTKSFRSQFGLNISAYLQNLRITHAKRLLRFSGKSVEEIGYEVGIGNPSYFSRVFKNVEGVSPKTYREQW